MDALDDNALAEVLERLHPMDLCTAALVCRRWNDALHAHDQYVLRVHSAALGLGGRVDDMRAFLHLLAQPGPTAQCTWEGVHQRMVTNIATDGPDAVVTSSHDFTMQVRDHGVRWHHEHPDWPTNVLFCAGGSLIVSGSRDGRVRVFSRAARALVRSAPVHPHAPRARAWVMITAMCTLAHPVHGELLCIGTASGTITLWCVDTRDAERDGSDVAGTPWREVARVDHAHSGSVQSLAATPHHTLLSSGGVGDGTVARWTMHAAGTPEEMWRRPVARNAWYVASLQRSGRAQFVVFFDGGSLLLARDGTPLGPAVDVARTGDATTAHVHEATGRIFVFSASARALTVSVAGEPAHTRVLELPGCGQLASLHVCAPHLFLGRATGDVGRCGASAVQHTAEG